MRIVTCIFTAVLMTAGHVQGGVITTENFESLSTGALNGQGGWTTTNGSPEVRSSNQTGSLAGNTVFANSSANAFRHDGFNYLSASDQQMTMSFSGLAGGKWSRAGVGYFDGTTFEIGMLFGDFGSRWGADVGGTNAFSNNNYPAGSPGIYDMRIVVDLVNETGSFAVENSEQAGINWITPTGMDNFSLSALDTGATDATNPLNWNSLYFRSLGNEDYYDNFSLSSSGAAAIPEPSSIVLLGSLFGCLCVRRRRRLV